MLSATSLRLRPTALVLLLTLPGGCVTLGGTKPCPPVAPYPAGLADRVETLGQNDPLFVAMADYFVLHEQCR